MSCQSDEHAEIICDCRSRDLAGLRSNHIYPSGNFSIMGLQNRRRTIAAGLQAAGGKRSHVRSATPDMFID
ncbi:hypothetical protein ASC97_08860 [Rhizobium sp. Root1203]|nr:hypothetical protein ASC97_08860 [Rhizobium sp. Root1203]